jgi:hypothetical protein
MKYFLMDGRIDKELLEKFVSFFNNHSSDECTILLHSRGGDNYISEVVVGMISKMINVTLIISSVYSSGLYIAYQSKCKKVLSATAKGMWHYGRATIDFGTNSKPYYNEDECVVRNFSIEKKADESFARKIMTKAEYILYKKNEEIYFDMTRMKQIFPDATILK